MLDLTTSLTGAVITGLTSPTYDLVEDEKPSLNARQSIVTALGGTQTGVRTHSPTDPFVVTISKPNVSANLPQVPLNGVLGRVARNLTSFVTRKGTLPLIGQNPQVSEIRTDMKVIAGAEVNDLPNIAAALSVHIGMLTRERNNLYTAIKLGTT